MATVSAVHITWQTLIDKDYAYERPNVVLFAGVLTISSWAGLTLVGIVYLTKLIYNRYKRKQQ